MAVVAATLAVPSAVPVASAAGSCTPVTNIQAIIDDSGSMSGTDPTRLRVQAVGLLIDAVSDSTTVGATEFGDEVDAVFAPAPVGPNALAMKAALSSLVNADNGSTDYNLAFDTARAANPGAGARIFLTDGGHNAGDYTNQHLNPTGAQTPTYVIGFSPGLAAPEDQARLQQIATDTGGTYYPLPDASSLQSVMTSIETKLTCQTPPKAFVDSIKQHKSKSHVVNVKKSVKSLQLTMSWASDLDQFKISGIHIEQGGKTVAAKVKKPRHLKVKTKKASTYWVVTITKLVPGKLHFTVKAKKLGSGDPKVSVTSQVSQSKKK